MSRQLADIGLVHGAGFEFRDGMQLASMATEARALQAVQLVRSGQIGHVVLSGYGPLEDGDYKNSEAEQMWRIMREYHIPHSQVSLEEKSTSTLGNWVLSAEVIESLGNWKTVIGITDRAHAHRALPLGVFVADKSRFELMGYASSLDIGDRSAHLREKAGRIVTQKFINDNRETERSELLANYAEFKQKYSLQRAKKLLHLKNGFSY
jgi:vancomycin permeability regulator SanA